MAPSTTERVVGWTLTGVLVATLLLRSPLTRRPLELAADEAVFQPAPLPPVAGDEPYLRIHVAGAVKRPGVYRLRADDRVIDALQAAGGQRADARLDDLNLAARLTDGLRLYVPGRDDRPADEILIVTEDIWVRPPPAPPAPIAPAGPPVETWLGAVTPAEPPVGGQRKEPPLTPVNINRATLEELQQLPGIGPTLARRILAYRELHGKFQAPAELTRVSGIGDKTFAKMERWVLVE